MSNGGSLCMHHLLLPVSAPPPPSLVLTEISCRYHAAALQDRQTKCDRIYTVIGCHEIGTINVLKLIFFLNVTYLREKYFKTMMHLSNEIFFVLKFRCGLYSHKYSIKPKLQQMWTKWIKQIPLFKINQWSYLVLIFFWVVFQHLFLQLHFLKQR